MTLQTCTTIILDPVTEHETIRKYEQDSGWVKTSETMVGYMFELRSPQYVTDALYFPSDRPREEGD